MPKRRKSALKTKKKDEKIDRISDLPDSILTHILGKLPTKNAVGTAVLSTRWRNLFSQIPNPDISVDDGELLYPEPVHSQLHYEILDPFHHRRKANFIKFMYNLLDVTLHDVPRIRKFHLDLSINYDYDKEKGIKEGYFCNDHVSKWISAALRLNVSYLWFFSPSYFNGSTEKIFSCASLVEIMLDLSADIDVSSSVCLPNLKCLYLKHVFFHDDGLENVLSGCPVLEELCLCYCEFSVHKCIDVDSHVVRIFSPSVKRFKWFNCVNDHTYGMEFDMPALDSLCYDDYLPEYFLVKNLNSLRKAYIDPWPTLEQLEGLQQEDHVHHVKNVADLVLGCSNVEFLCLSHHFIEAFCFSINLLPPFHNLIVLELPKIGLHGWMLLPYLLKNAPNLETLVFAKGFHLFKGGYKVFLSHVGQCSTCLALNLQMIRFEDFDGEVDKINLVEYFLKNAKNLRKIEIKLSLLCEEELVKAASKIEILQKSSKKCHIELMFGVVGERKNKTDRSFGMREWS